jgi:hypothetical protein
VLLDICFVGIRYILVPGIVVEEVSVVGWAIRNVDAWSWIALWSDLEEDVRYLVTRNESAGDMTYDLSDFAVTARAY